MLTSLAPIPILDDPPDTGAREQARFAPGDPRAAEPLVDLRRLGFCGASYYAREDGGNAPYHRKLAGSLAGVWVRAGVAERLAQAEDVLRRLGVRLFVHDGFRTLACQTALWDFFYERERAADPSAENSALARRTRRFISDPRGTHPAQPGSWPLHITGGAVDVGLADADGAPLDMGAAFDAMGPEAATDFYERAARAGHIGPDHPALLRRRTLYTAMTRAGFTNYPFEYFHYDYGTSLYAVMRQRAGDADAAAFYPPAECPEAA